MHSLAWLWWLASTTGGAAASSECDLLKYDCSLIDNKLPRITRSVMQPGTAVTASLAADDRRAFEHVVGHALRATPAVTWTTATFARRMRAFLVGGSALNGTTADDALTAAFITSTCGPANTGYVGPFLPAIDAALSAGNIREVWGLMYVLTKTHYFNTLLLALLTPPKQGAPPLATPASLQAKFGMDAAYLTERWKLVRESQMLNSSALRYAQGFPDFEYESFESWVRFDFPSETHDGTKQWAGARDYKKGGCTTERRMSDDPSIEPSLSAAELRYQCGSEEAAAAARSAGKPCVLQWQPGMLCYDLPNATWTLPDGSVVPGLNERAALLGYRSAAAASGTTANMIEMGRALGFTGDELVLLRLTMAAWMLPTDDHSFFEIMLGGEPYVPPAFRMALGRDDLGQLWPSNATLKTADGEHAFAPSEFWQQQLGPRLSSPAGKALLDRMAPDAQGYVTRLVSTSSGAAAESAALDALRAGS